MKTTFLLWPRRSHHLILEGQHEMLVIVWAATSNLDFWTFWNWKLVERPIICASPSGVPCNVVNLCTIYDAYGLSLLQMFQVPAHGSPIGKG